MNPILNRTHLASTLVMQEANILAKWGTELSSSQIDANTKNLVRLITLSQEKGGSLHLTGIGKNIPALQKAAATMKSLGIRAHVFCAVDALHGDLGVVKKEDVVIAMSKSGNTDELIKTLNYMKEHNIGLLVGMSMTYNKSLHKPCSFDQVCDLSLKLPEIDEIDNWNRVPTASALAFQMYLDAIAMLVAHSLGVKDSDFKLYHPGGAIGTQFKREEKHHSTATHKPGPGGQGSLFEGTRQPGSDSHLHYYSNTTFGPTEDK